MELSYLQSHPIQNNLLDIVSTDFDMKESFQACNVSDEKDLLLVTKYMQTAIYEYIVKYNQFYL